MADEMTDRMSRVRDGCIDVVDRVTAAVSQPRGSRRPEPVEVADREVRSSEQRDPLPQVRLRLGMLDSVFFAQPLIEAPELIGQIVARVDDGDAVLVQGLHEGTARLLSRFWRGPSPSHSLRMSQYRLHEVSPRRSERQKSFTDHAVIVRAARVSSGG
jgi:hypothetical protein